MGQSATLYRISKSEFERLSKDPLSFDYEKAEGYKLFDQNFLGISYLLDKASRGLHSDLVNEIFSPDAYLGTSHEFDPDRIVEVSTSDTDPIFYTDTAKVKQIKEFLDSIDKENFLNLYNSKELNDNGVYPCVWHDDESHDRAFNRRHLTEGFDDLRIVFTDSLVNDNIILSFVG